ncbi:MAG: serine hydrolase, partial [Acidobacteria bacterium]|nr:serine hydrolase [Acidobacteriota bacterium]
NLTIRDTLTHRAGYKSFDGDLLWYRTGYSSDEVLKRFEKMPLKYGIRTRYGYSNIMFMVAGKVIEKISGKSYSEFINERIFKPLEMDNSYLEAQAIKNNPMLAKPYKGEIEIPFEDFDVIAPAGGVNTTVEDSLKWVNMLLKKGQVGDKQVLSGNIYSELVSPQFVIPVNGIQRAAGISFNHYALGWYTYEYNGKTVVMHQGGLPGYISEIVLIPSENTGFVIFSNELNLLPMMLVYKLLDEILGIQGQDWAKQGLMYNSMITEHDKMIEKELLEKQAKGTKPTLKLEDYTGNYHDDMYGNARITFNDGTLSVQLLPPNGELKSKLEHYQGDSFLVKFNDDFIPPGLIVFAFDKGGNIVGFSFKIDINDFNFENLYFQKDR